MQRNYIFPMQDKKSTVKMKGDIKAENKKGRHSRTALNIFSTNYLRLFTCFSTEDFKLAAFLL
jgi:hypothetical protein